MGLGNVWEALRRPKYSLILFTAAVLVGWLYAGLLNDPRSFDAIGWIFAVLFPTLVGLTIAMQWYNLAERRSCTASTSSGGILGGVAGIVTTTCPVCPSLLASWVGLGAGAAGVLGGPWIKLGSLAILMVSLYWASK